MRGDPGKIWGNAVAWDDPEPMIKLSSEAVTDNVLKGLVFSGENEEVMRSPRLCKPNHRAPPHNFRSYIKVT